MNAEKFFERYSIEEINKKTRISPISLRYIKNKEFEKIPRVKFMGFIKLIEREFNVDLSELVEEYNLATKHIKEEPPKKEPKKETSKNKIVIATAVLILIGALIGLYKYSSATKETPLPNDPIFTLEFNETTSKTVKKEENNTLPSKLPPQLPTKKEITLKEENKTAIPKPIQTPQIKQKETDKDFNDTLVIIPHKLVWFSAKNLDTNKTFEILTSQKQILKGKNWLIKFGRAMVTIKYAGKTFEPNRDRVTRILLKNGKMEIIEK